jgi:hypothetical protein
VLSSTIPQVPHIYKYSTLKRPRAGLGLGANIVNLSGTAYHPEFGQLMQYEAFPLSDDPDTQVAQTIHRMARHYREDAKSSPILNEAAAIRAYGSGDPCSDTFWHVRGKVGFRQDEQLAAPIWRGDGDPVDGGQVVEVLIRPRDLAQMDRPLEDCDGFASYLPTLLKAQGVPCKFVTVAADARDPSRFSHVYAACTDPNTGQRISLDASHGPYPGWECLSAGPVWRIKEWDIDGPDFGSLFLIAGVLFLAAKVWGIL